MFGSAFLTALDGLGQIGKSACLDDLLTRGRVRHGAGHQAPASLNQVWPWPFKPWYPSEMATAAPPQRHHAGSVKVASARNSDDPRWSAALSVQCHDRGHDASRHGGRRFLVRTAAQWCSRGDHSRGERSQGRGCVARSVHSTLTPPSLLPSPALSSPPPTPKCGCSSLEYVFV